MVSTGPHLLGLVVSSCLHFAVQHISIPFAEAPPDIARLEADNLFTCQHGSLCSSVIIDRRPMGCLSFKKEACTLRLKPLPSLQQ